MNWKVAAAVPAALALMVVSASAHPGVGDATGLVHGMIHPVSGIDHVLAMVTVGLFAAHLGGRALWLVPASFVAMMAVGGALGFYGITLPLIETGIAFSVIVLGAVVALRTSLPLTAAMGLVGVFAVFHGHAHGTEMPAAMSALTYAAGFLLATALLHAAGVGLGLAIGRLSGQHGERVAQFAGTGIALAGVAILLGAI